MERLPLTALRAYCAIYSSGGVRAAARALHISHSAVSRHLRELEALLGVALIERADGARGPLAFTRAGHALGQGASSCLEGLGNVVAAVREDQRDSSVTLATTPSVAARWLLPRLPALRRRHPWIEVSVVADQRPRSPADDGADLAIRMGARAVRGVPSEPLMSESLYPVVSPEAWVEADRATDLERLARRLGLLHDRDPQTAWARWREARGPHALNVRHGARLTSSDLVLGAAEQGLGIALARGRLACGTLAAGRLLRPLGDEALDLADAYWLVGDLGGGVRESVGLCADWLRETACDA